MKTISGSPRQISNGITALWIIGLLLVPLLYVFILSFASRGTYGDVVFQWGFQNYLRLFSPDFFPILAATLGRSALMAALTTLICAGLAYPFVLIVLGLTPKPRLLALFLLFLPFWTNFLIRTYAWFAMFSEQGWFNATLAELGLPTLNLLFSPTAILMGMVYNFLPFMALSLFVSLQKLDRQMPEAARDLGATPWRVFTTVILPLSRPGLVVGTIVTLIPAFGEFVIPDILGGGKTTYIGNLLVQQFLVARNWPMGAAISSLTILLMLIGIYWLKRLELRLEQKS